MARKYELITDLYYQTINEVSENAEKRQEEIFAFVLMNRYLSMLKGQMLLLFQKSRNGTIVLEDGSIKVLKVSETKAFDMEGALKQVQKLIDGGMKTKEAIKRVAQEMNGSKNELYDAYHKHI